MFEALPMAMAIMGVTPYEEGDGDKKEEEEDMAGT
jgi:hypothetical protein